MRWIYYQSEEKSQQALVHHAIQDWSEAAGQHNIWAYPRIHLLERQDDIVPFWTAVDTMQYCMLA